MTASFQAPLTGVPEQVDVLVLGAGGAGYPGAFFLAKAGLSVLMVDPIGNLGGDCLAEGCVPSKAMREAALVRGLADKFAGFGLRGSKPTVDWPAVLSHKDRVQNTRYAQHAQEIADSGVLFVQGRGAIVALDQARIDTDDGASRTVRFRHLMLATGSAPARLPILGADLALTSHDLFRLGADLPLPRHLVVIGGGYIGVETASMLQALGVECTVLEFAPQLLPGFDAELAASLLASLSQRVHIERSAQVLSIAREGDGFYVRYKQDGGERSVHADAVLMATGRVPVLPEGVEHLGLALDSGHVVVDETLRTSNPQVWAPGDVNGRSMLFHSAVRQSLVAAHCIAAGGQAVDLMHFGAVPMTVFTEPELAHVGQTAAQAEAALGAGAVTVTRYDYAQDSRAQIYCETQGFIKLVFRRADGRLLGAQIAGMDAAQLITPLALALEQGSTAAALADAVFPHPMLSEGINKAARAFRP
ncbi:dihydrolipoyl dehydrogenase [Thiomonas bhubaneswarensis]|uniref:Pyruvate/2-oxoglutarate dehydrogenase complex, dihydrolipoamide dehydrogenase (E3) component or related enzyme n=1 Tax=Thiomonas bhubaneswarensis TaxID=339866 RepID=A0A0K6I078_9BURK|nr:dihydrolipoyl dehydrogenase [Thiomonas bhubaneswarensis]CUA96564.1 Pyruvate/2-oxoglutarate dehydrogenase complex, dihydrolipoamide dehydrogenase (E3) component or related enzyme [Thiomonas bhubaneswarensis]